MAGAYNKSMMNLFDDKPYKVTVSHGPGHFTWESLSELERRNSLEEKLKNFTGDLVPITSDCALKHKRKLKEHQLKAKTTETSYVEGDSYNDHTRALFSQDCHDDFNEQKRATLRQSPALVLKPKQQPECYLGEQRSGTSRLSLSTADNKEIWSTHITNDAQFYGEPRPDPYKSEWTSDQRRCFFMSSFVPPHQRDMYPAILTSNAQSIATSIAFENQWPFRP